MICKKSPIFGRKRAETIKKKHFPRVYARKMIIFAPKKMVINYDYR